MRTSTCVSLLLIALLSPIVFAFDDAPSNARDRSQLTWSIKPLVDLHQQVRNAAETSDSAPDSLDSRAWEQAVAAARAIDPLTWGMIEGNFLAAQTAEEALAISQELPETLRRGEDEIILREHAEAYARALLQLEDDFLRHLWPQREQALKAARATLEATLGEHEAACLAHLIASYGMDDPSITIPIHLVSRAPSPGAATFRTRRGSECIIAIDSLPPLQLAEIVLHEASHALDVATMRQPTALMQLRQRLQSAGIAPTDRRHRDIWHTIMFIQSAETVRRIIDESHEDYGDRSGYYARVEPIADIQRQIWRAYLDGEIMLEVAVKRVVEALAAD